MPDYYTPKEVAEMLNVKLRAVQYWIKKGKIKAFQIGKFWRIKKSDYDEFVNNLPDNQPKKGESES